MVKLIRNAIQSKFIYEGRGIAFDAEFSWSFGNDVTRNVIIYGVDNTFLSHNDNRKNNFLVLVEGPTDGMNDSTGPAEIIFCINFTEANKALF